MWRGLVRAAPFLFLSQSQSLQWPWELLSWGDNCEVLDSVNLNVTWSEGFYLIPRGPETPLGA